MDLENNPLKFKAGFVSSAFYVVNVESEKIVNGVIELVTKKQSKNFMIYAVLEEDPAKLADICSGLEMQGMEYFESVGIDKDYELTTIQDNEPFAGCVTFIVPSMQFTSGTAILGISKQGARAGKHYISLDRDNTDLQDIAYNKQTLDLVGVDTTSELYQSKLIDKLINRQHPVSAGSDDMDYLRLKSRKTAPVVEKEPKAKTKKADPKEAELK